MTRMTGSQALVEMLRRHGIDTLFALPGVQNDALFSALYDARNAVRVIHTRHEQAVAYMAQGYAMSTGRVGAYAVVPGPGFLNTTAALATSYATNTPVLAISGQIPSHLIGRGFGMLHEIPDQLAIMRGLTKWAARIAHPGQTGTLVNEAFRQLRNGRAQPVGLEMPLDVMALETEVELPEADDAAPVPALDLDEIEKAARLLAEARKPMIIVGGGALEAGEPLLAVAEMLQAPVIANLAGKGIVSDRHYLAHTATAGRELWREADVVLGVGSRMLHPLTLWGLDENIKVIRIDIDPAAVARIRKPALGIVADARRALAALHDALLRHNKKRPSREAELAALKSRMHTEFVKLSPQYEFLTALRAELPEDGIFVDELTQVGYVGRLAFPTYRPRSFLHTGYQGTLGAGFPMALGAKVANPDRPVVSISGDGGFLYNVQELASAVQHGIDIVAVVFADGAYGNVKRIQQEDYGNKVIAVDLRNPSFTKMAESFGAAGVRATTPDELRREIRAGLARRGTTLIEVPVGEMPGPWKLIYMPRVRGTAAG